MEVGHSDRDSRTYNANRWHTVSPTDAYISISFSHELLTRFGKGAYRAAALNTHILIDVSLGIMVIFPVAIN